MADRGLTGRDLRNAILFAALVYLAIQFIGQIVDVLLIFSIIALLVVALSPTVTWLERHKIPRRVSAGFLALLVLGGIGLLLYIAVPPLERQIRQLIIDAPALVGSVRPWLAGLAERYPSIANYVPEEGAINVSTIQQIASSVLGGVTRIGASAVSIAAGTFLIFISTIYALADPKPLTDGILNVFKPDYRPRVEATAGRLSTQIRAWAKGTLIAMFFVFLLTWVALWLIGLEQAFLFAVIAGLLEAVPIVGPVISAVPPTLVALFLSPITALWVVLAFVIIQQIENNVLVPMVMSRQLSLHPVTVIFAVLVMGGLFGILGVFLAAPAAATAGVLFDALYLCEYEHRCGEVGLEELPKKDEDA